MTGFNVPASVRLALLAWVQSDFQLQLLFEVIQDAQELGASGLGQGVGNALPKPLDVVGVGRDR